MKTTGKNAYMGTYERLPPWWGGYLSRNLFRASHAPGYALSQNNNPYADSSTDVKAAPTQGMASFVGEAKMTVCEQELNRSEKEKILNETL